MDHHRAEVGHVLDLLAGLLQGDALLGAQAGELLGVLLQQFGVVGGSDPGGGDVQAQLGGAGTHGCLVPQQHQVGDASAQNGVGGSQDPVVIGLGQDDRPAVGAGALHQLGLEHDGGDHLGGLDLQGGQEGVDVGLLLEGGHGDVDLALGAVGEQALEGAGRRGGGEGVQRRGDDRDVDVQALQKAQRVGCHVEAAVEDEAGQDREAGGGLGRHERDEHGGAVCRHDGELPRGQALQDVGDIHGAHEDGLGLAVQQGLVAGDKRALDGAQYLADRRSGQEGHLGQRGGGDALDRGQGLGDALTGLRTALIGHDRDGAGVVVGDLSHGDLDGPDDVLHVVLAGDYQQDRHADVGGHLGVEGQLGIACDVGEVRAVDDDDVVLARQGPVGVDDTCQGLLGVGVELVPGRADALLGGRGGAGTVQQEAEEGIALTALHEGAEDADLGDHLGQTGDQPEGHR